MNIKEIVLPVAMVGGIGLLAYVLIMNQKGVQEALQSFGDAMKSSVDALNSVGKGIGDWSYNVQHQAWKNQQTALNKGCWMQKAVLPWTQCTDLNKEPLDAKKQYLRLALGGNKPVPKITNTF